jgi:hypothetical protein
MVARTRVRAWINHVRAFDKHVLRLLELTRENAATLHVPRIQESFLKLEFTFQWERALCPDSTNVTVCIAYSA